MKIAGIAKDFTPYARALSEANQNGRITLEGTIKGGHTSILKNHLLFGGGGEPSLSSSILGFRVEEFSFIFSSSTLDPDFSFSLFFSKFRIREFVIFRHKYLFSFNSSFSVLQVNFDFFKILFL